MLVRVAFVSAFAIGCVKHMPPAPTPQAVPQAEANTQPLESGNGRLIIDVVDGPTPVSEITMRSEPVSSPTGRTSFRFSEVDAVICETTPCVVDRPPGNVILAFPVVGDVGVRIDMVHISEQPSVYRRNLAVYRRSQRGGLYTLGIVGTAVGAAGLVTGATLLPIGLGTDSSGLTIAGAASLAAGALLTTLGVVTFRGHADVFRPGSSLHYPL